VSDPNAHNDQPGHIIERSGDATPSYFSRKIGRDFGQPHGGWTSEREQATIFETTQETDELLESALAHVAPFCRVVPA
jgi:hypothetical protein